MSLSRILSDREPAAGGLSGAIGEPLSTLRRAVEGSVGREPTEMETSVPALLLAASVPALARGLLAWIAAPERPWHVLGVATTARQLRRGLSQRPSVVVVTQTIGGENWLDLVVRSAAPSTPVLLLAGSVTPAREADILRSGAAGVLPLDCSEQMLIERLTEIVAGRVSMRADAFLHLVRGGPATRLTARQKEVLRLLAQGRSTDDMASHLTVSPSTIKTHVARLADRFGLSGRLELAARAADLPQNEGSSPLNAARPSRFARSEIEPGP